MSSRVTSVIVLVLCVLASEVLAGEGKTRGPAYKPGEIIVKFKQGAAKTLEEQLSGGKVAGTLNLSASLHELNRRHKVKSIKPLIKGFKANRQLTKGLFTKAEASLTKREKHILRRLKRAPKGVKVPELDRIYVIELEDGQSAEYAAAEYRQNPDVEYAELNYIVHAATLPNDPYYNVQWALNNTGQSYPVSGGGSDFGTAGADINAPEAWDLNTGGSDIIIAVIDSGVDYTHRDLVDNMWTDSDGYYGYDFVNNDNDPMDDFGHGTHCAGIIAGRGNNVLDITGVCWSAKIMAVKFLDSDGFGSDSGAANAIYYASDNGADVLSNSWGGYYSESIEDAMSYAYSQGAIIVAAAGNDNSDLPTYPAYYDHVLSVAATDSDDNKASFSNYGEWVDLAAPGVDILSLRGKDTDMYLGSLGYQAGSSFVPFGDPNATMYVASGTSMACPYVAGACALMLSANPFLASEEVNDILAATVDPIADGICHCDGRLNLSEALIEAILSTSKGRIALDSDYYNCDSNIGIFLADCDLSGEGTEAISITSSGGDSETVVLTEGSPPVGTFRGAIHTTTGAPNIGDGNLQVTHGDIVDVTYYDANDGTGNPATATDNSTIDCMQPVISNIQMNVKGNKLIVTFNSNEPTTGKVSCGEVCGGPYTLEGYSHIQTSHTVEVKLLLPFTTYYFIVTATDAAGNETVDLNSGNCYSFTTTGPGNIYVPSQYLTIQDGVDHSWPGSVVWVADGIYTGTGNRDIDVQGKAITVRSENGPENCIIDCQGYADNPHRGFCFENHEGADSAVDGFTITNGYGPADYWDGVDFRYAGGGIYCHYSNPTIENCIISGNKTSYAPGHGDGVGGGICCDNSGPIISNCIIIGNTSGYAYGGGVFGQNSNVSIIDCMISGNYGGNGCGGYFYKGSPIIERCVISNNESSGAGTRGSLYFDAGSAPEITNCFITGNMAYPGGICCWSSGGNATISNCTIVNNYPATYGGAIYWDGPATITNCILWGNGDELHKCSATYCCIDDDDTGVGNINSNPLLLITDSYYLSPNSPCIDAGTNSPPGGLPSTDLDGSPRPLDGDSNGVSTADMGAYEFDSALPPILLRSPWRFKFYGVEDGPNPADQILSVRNIGGGELSWEITESCSWLEVIPNSGESAGETDEVAVRIDSSGLDIGTYQCILTITGAGAINNPQIVVIDLSIGQPEIWLSTDEIRFLAMPSEPNSPEQILTIRNSGLGILNWKIDYDCDWLQVDPNKGCSTEEPDEIILSVDYTNLDEDIYTCELTISDECAANSPRTVEVILHLGILNILVPSRFPDIKTAIYYSADGDTVILADGAYTGSGNRNIDFMNRAITVKSENGPSNCIIDAEYHGRVFNFDGEGADSIVDGLTIRHGQVYCEPGVPCPFTFFGGGIYCDIPSDASPTIQNCIITENFAHFGGGIYGGSPTVINCIFKQNVAEISGAAIDARGSEVINCTFTGNTSPGSIVHLASDSLIINSILWNNTGNLLSSSGTVIYNDIEGGWSGTGNINANPRFVTGPEGYYYLSQTAAGQSVDSPCVNAGSDTAANLGMNFATTRTDKYSDIGIVDIGYHYPTDIFVMSADIDENWYIDFFDFAILAADWLECSDPCDLSCTTGPLPGDIIKDDHINIYDLAFFVDYWLDCIVAPAYGPYPADGAKVVDPNLVLKWIASDGALEHDVYLGTDSNAVANGGYFADEYMGTVSDEIFDPCSLDVNTTYFWRIDEAGPKCTTKGDVWNFTTWAEPNFYLAAHWKFDEGSGNVAGDYSGNDNNGAITGATWFDDPCRGMCLSFDGNGDYVMVGDKADLEQQEFTLSFWARLNNPSGALQGGIAKGHIFGSVSEFSYKMDFDSGLIWPGITNTSDIGFGVQGSIGDSNWHMWSMTVGGGTLTLYKDGDYVSSTEYTGTIDYTKSHNNFVIGARDDGSYAFNGRIDDVRIYNRVLSEEEVEDLYEGGV